MVLLFTTNSFAFCFEEAGAMYGVNPTILWSIAKTESSFNSKAIGHNSNSTYDYGLMQINSIWAKPLGKEIWKSLSDPCQNVKVGAWILSKCIKQYGYNWQAIGCYHSRTPSKRDNYAKKIYKNLKALEQNPVTAVSYKDTKQYNEAPVSIQTNDKNKDIGIAEKSEYLSESPDKTNPYPDSQLVFLSFDK